ncbi:hypothetical protein NT6N_35940 [Oceaniferula spumae]|uniref:exo-alpha-sialidase n=1 Tax=Oceaniferula spumae TaxID=2979115 RepID=A0AAT9FRN3_9BACT
MNPLILTLSLALGASLHAEFQLSADWPESSTVYDVARDTAGEHRYTNYREPVIVRTNSGKLILGVQAGNRHAWPERSGQDLTVRVSSDNGKSWGPVIVAAEAGDFSCQCHGLVYDAEKDRVLFLYTTYNWDYQLVGKGRGAKYTAPLYQKLAAEKKPFVTSYMVYSDDDGKTWSKPYDITKQVGRQAHFGASEGRQLTVGKHKGRLLLAGSRMDLNEKGNITHKHLGAWYSDDHGKTWALAEVPMDEKINTPRNASSEARITELADGTLLYNQRTRKTGRHLSWSKDSGASWNQTEQATQLKVTQCNGSLMTLRDKSGKLTNTVLFSVPSPGGRSNGMIYISKDGGKTWPIAKNVIKGNFAYSALIQIDGENVGLFYETGHYKQINFVSLPIEKLTRP